MRYVLAMVVVSAGMLAQSKPPSCPADRPRLVVLRTLMAAESDTEPIYYHSYHTAICFQSLSGFFKQACNPDQNYRPNQCHNNGTYDSASRPDSQQPKDTAAHKT